MLKEPQTSRYSVRHTHRTYTAQFKAELVAACQRPGASIAALALQHDMNANVLHRWLKEYHQQGLHDLHGTVTPAIAGALPSPAFIPIELGTSSSASANPHEPCAEPSVIRIECQRRGTSVTVHWPLDAAGECAQVLRELLR